MSIHPRPQHPELNSALLPLVSLLFLAPGVGSAEPPSTTGASSTSTEAHPGGRTGPVRRHIKEHLDRWQNCPPNRDGTPRDCQLKLSLEIPDSDKSHATEGGGAFRAESPSELDLGEESTAYLYHTIMINYASIRVTTAAEISEAFGAESCTLCTYGDSRTECLGEGTYADSPLATLTCSGSTHASKKLDELVTEDPEYGFLKPCPSTDTGFAHEGEDYTLRTLWENSDVYGVDTVISLCPADDSLAEGWEDRCTFGGEPLDPHGLPVLYFGIAFGETERPEGITVTCRGETGSILTGVLELTVNSAYTSAESGAPEGKSVKNPECELSDYYLDRDGDGYPGGNKPESPSYLGQFCAAPHMLFDRERAIPVNDLTSHPREDCDDDDPNLHPSAVEICGDGQDNDCDDITDPFALCEEDSADQDQDGFTIGQGDCDDRNKDVAPGSNDGCDGEDSDCDGEVDEDASWSAFYVDYDQDGYPALKDDDGDGVPDTLSRCRHDAGYFPAPADPTTLEFDCADLYADSFPGATEVCDGIDNDCDKAIDETVDLGIPNICTVADFDGDGFNSRKHGGEDCDDQHKTVNPEAKEECDGLDNDCDGQTDRYAVSAEEIEAFEAREGATGAIYYLDVDGDGYGDDSVALWACAPPPGYANKGGDCAPTDPVWHPKTPLYKDVDGDGYGIGPMRHNPQECTGFDSYTALLDGDCDDGAPFVSPGATEFCDRIDNDCDNGIDNACVNPGEGVTCETHFAPDVIDLHVEAEGEWISGFPLCAGASTGDGPVTQRFRPRFFFDDLAPWEYLVVDIRLAELDGGATPSLGAPIGLGLVDAAGVPVVYAQCVGSDDPLCVVPTLEEGRWTYSIPLTLPLGFEGAARLAPWSGDLELLLTTAGGDLEGLYDLRLRRADLVDPLEGEGGNDSEATAFDLVEVAQYGSDFDPFFLYDSRLGPDRSLTALPSLRVHEDGSGDLKDVYRVQVVESDDDQLLRDFTLSLSLPANSDGTSISVRVLPADGSSALLDEMLTVAPGQPTPTMYLARTFTWGLQNPFYVEVALVSAPAQAWLPYHLHLTTFSAGNSGGCEDSRDDDALEPNNVWEELGEAHRIFDDGCGGPGRDAYINQSLRACPVDPVVPTYEDGKDLFGLGTLVGGDLIECSAWSSRNYLDLALSLWDAHQGPLEQRNRYHVSSEYTGHPDTTHTIYYEVPPGGLDAPFLEVSFPRGWASQYGLACHRLSIVAPLCD